MKTCIHVIARSFATLSALLLIAAPGSSQNRIPLEECIEPVDTIRGDNCNNRNSVRAVFQNRCTERLRATFCLEKSDGSWQCGRARFEPRGENAYYTCSGTGRYRIDKVDRE